MKDLKHIKRFNEVSENLNISDVSNNYFKTPVIIDLEFSDRNIRKSIFDKLYNLGYKWNNGYIYGCWC
jgi:hypothetical protein